MISVNASPTALHHSLQELCCQLLPRCVDLSEHFDELIDSQQLKTKSLLFTVYRSVLW